MHKVKDGPRARLPGARAQAPVCKRHHTWVAARVSARMACVSLHAYTFSMTRARQIACAWVDLAQAPLESWVRHWTVGLGSLRLGPCWLLRLCAVLSANLPCRFGWRLAKLHSRLHVARLRPCLFPLVFFKPLSHQKESYHLRISNKIGL